MGKDFPLHPVIANPLPKSSSPISPIPGLHIVANFGVSDREKLTDATQFEKFINDEILKFKLTKVGEVYHPFPKGGYTAVICLTESHLSIHTWPERSYLTFDIFLSNFLRDNRETTVGIYENVRKFFDAVVLFEKTIDR